MVEREKRDQPDKRCSSQPKECGCRKRWRWRGRRGDSEGGGDGGGGKGGGEGGGGEGGGGEGGGKGGGGEGGGESGGERRERKAPTLFTREARVAARVAVARYFGECGTQGVVEALLQRGAKKASGAAFHAA